MQSVETETERTRRRIAVKGSKLSGVLDSLLEETEQAILELEGAQKEQIAGIVKSRSDRLAGMKPLTAMKQQHKDSFQFISKLGKIIDKTVQPSFKDLAFDLDDCKLFRIVEGHMEESSANLSKSEEKEKGRLEACKELLQKLTAHQFEDVLKILDNEDMVASHNEAEMRLDICKLVFLDKVQAGRRGEGVIFLRKNKGGLTGHQQEEIGELLHSVCFSCDQTLPRRLKLARDTDSLVEKCAAKLRKTIRRLKGLPETSPFTQLYSAGLIAISEIARHRVTTEDLQGQEELDVAVTLPQTMVFHSALYCPISKDVCRPDINPPLLQNCGHLVGQASVKKMLEAGRERRLASPGIFKCPTCPNQQDLASLKVVKY